MQETIHNSTDTLAPAATTAKTNHEWNAYPLDINFSKRTG
jgi:hypothetical protein